MQNSIRAFIAVEIDDAVRIKLAAMQDVLKEANAHVSWVKPQNIHCTLVFLGDIFAGTVNSIAAALNQAAAACKPFEIEITGLGFFGSPRSPRIIWAGITGAVTPLVKLQSDIVANALAAGLKFDSKPFKPHLSVGRVRSNRNAQALVKAIEAGKDESFGKLVVQRAVLMKSILGPQGPEYSVLQAAPFGDE